MGVGGPLIRVLGTVEAEISGAAIDLGGPRQRAVLALLIAARGNVVPIDRMVEQLWEGSPPQSARGALHAYLSNLRRLLEPTRPARGAAQYLLSTPPGYAFRLGTPSVDAWAFDTQLREATGVTDAARRAQNLQTALALWRGPAFAEFASTDWAGPEAARLEEMRLVAREQLVEARLAAGHHSEAATEADSLVREAPLREEAWRLLALSQYAATRQADALATLRRARRMLAEDLGVDPDPSLVELERSILRHDVQLPRNPGLAGRVAASTGLAPVVTTELVGRDRELIDVQSSLRDPLTRLVTITGPGGAGKTRLVVAAASDLAPHYPDGVHFAALHMADTNANAWPVIGEALGAGPADVDVDVSRPVLERLAPMRALLVLDNLEQLPAADEVVSAILTWAPAVDVLATSRRPLLLVGEREYPLAPLTLPASTDLADVQVSDAAQLFAQQARLARPSFAITRENCAAVAVLCRRLDGLPLALELAAAQSRVLGPRALLSHLNSQLGAELVAGDRPQRQRSVNAAIAWSYDLLETKDRAVFRRLGVFRSAIAIDAVAAVAAGEDEDRAVVLAAVGRLTAWSLVRIEEGPDGEPRVDLLETIRTFAVERLAGAAEYEVIRERHLTWCRDVVTRTVPMLRGPDHRAALSRLHALDNELRSALDFCVGSPAGQVDAVDLEFLIDVATRYWSFFGNVPEARHWLERGLAALRGEHSVQAVALLDGLAWAMLKQRDMSGCIDLFTKALDMARDLGDRHREAAQLHSLAIALDEAGRFTDAANLLRDSVGLAREIGDTEREGYVLTSLIWVHIDLGENTAAVAAAERALAFNEALSYKWMLAYSRLGWLLATLCLDGPDAALVRYARWAYEMISYDDNELLIEVTEIGALLAAGSGQPVIAAQVLASVDTHRASIPRRRSDVEFARMERWLRIAQQSISAQQWRAAYETGQHLTPQQAVDLVLSVGPAEQQ